MKPLPSCVRSGRGRCDCGTPPPPSPACPPTVPFLPRGRAPRRNLTEGRFIDESPCLAASVLALPAAFPAHPATDGGGNASVGGAAALGGAGGPDPPRRHPHRHAGRPDLRRRRAR